MVQFGKVYFSKDALLVFPCFGLVGVFISSGFSIKCPDTHSTGICRLLKRYFFPSPFTMYLLKIIRIGQSRPAERNAFCFRCRNPFRLALPDIGPFVLRHKGQHLQNNIAAAVTPYPNEHSSRIARPGPQAFVSYCRPESLAPNLNGLY